MKPQRNTKYSVNYSKVFVLVGWIWFATRFVSLFVQFRSEHTSLHHEALLLLDGPCSYSNAQITGALIKCEQARLIRNGKTWSSVYAIENAIKTLFVEIFRNTTYELINIIKLLGFICTLLFTAAFVVHAVYIRVHQNTYTYSSHYETYRNKKMLQYLTERQNSLPIAGPRRIGINTYVPLDDARLEECSKFD